MPLIPRVRDYPAQHFGKILLTDDPRCPRGSLPSLGKLLANTVFAAIDSNLDRIAAGDLVNFDRILRGADADAFKDAAFFEGEHGADRHKTSRILGLQRHRCDELEVEYPVKGFAGKGRDQLR